jgi:hypothetical protein
VTVAARRLGPMGLGDIIDETIRIYRIGFKTFAGTMAVLMLPLAILMVPALFFTFRGLGDVEAAGGVLPVAVGLLAVVAGLVYACGFLVAGAACVRIASDIWRGDPTSVGRGYGVALRRVWALIGAILLVFLAVLGLAIVAVPLLVVGFTIGWIAAIIGLIVWFANPALRRPWLKWMIILCAPFGLMLYFVGLWTLYTPVVVLEGLGPLASLRRSSQLVRGYWWRVFGTTFLVSILVGILQAVPQAMFSAVAAALTAGLEAGAATDAFSTLARTQAINSLGTALAWVLFGAIQFIAMTLIYLDVRVRKEALDLEVLTEKLAPLGEAPAT